MGDFSIRFAAREDIPTILGFIRALAAYEKMEDQVIADETLLETWIFEKRKAEVLLAFEGVTPVGFALFFHNFSTWLGRAGIYLEDLFVLPEYRGRGIRQAVEAAAEAAGAHGTRCSAAAAGWTYRVGVPRLERAEHCVLGKSVGATALDEWTTYRA